MKNIQISGIIGWDYYASNLREELASADGDELTIDLSSPGGDAIEGLEIYSMLSDYEGHITVQLGTLVASAATLIPCAANWVIAKPSTIAYIHRSWVCACGDTDELSSGSKLLDGIDRIIAGVYAQRIGRPVDVLLVDMQRGTWLMGADELIKHGLADEEKESDELKKQKNALKQNAQKIIDDIDTKFRSLEEGRPAAMHTCDTKNKKSLVERIKAIKMRLTMPRDQTQKEQTEVDPKAQAEYEQVIKQLEGCPNARAEYEQLAKGLEGHPEIRDRVSAVISATVKAADNKITERMQWAVNNTLDIVIAAGYRLDEDTEAAAKKQQEAGVFALQKIKANQNVVIPTPKANADAIGGVSSARSPADTAPAGETSEGAQRWERIYQQKTKSK